MAVRRRLINRWTVFLLNLILSIQTGGAHANDDNIVKSLPRNLQDPIFACAGVDEISQEGNIYLEVIGRPAYLQEGHLHVLENALISLYESSAKQTCTTSGYRYLTGARVNRNSIPGTTDVVTFVIDFEVTGRCKGCADNIDFLSHFRRQRRIRASNISTPRPQEQSQRMLSSKKGSKKDSGSSRYYYTNYGSSRSSSSSSSRYYYYGVVDPTPPTTSTSSCFCPPPVVEGLEYAFGRIIRDILDLRSIYDGTPRLGGDGGTPVFPTPPAPVMPNPVPTPPAPVMPNPIPTPPAPVMPNPIPTPPPTMAMPNPNPTPPPTMGQEEPTPPPEPSSTPSLRPTANQPEPSASPSITQNNNCDAQNNAINYRSANCDVGTQDGYQICLEFLNMPCEDVALFDEAVAFWESIITNDLPDHNIPLSFLNDPTFCGPGYTVPSPTDDLFICAMYTAIDGTNNVLGTGTSVNDGSGEAKPILWGILKLDEADLGRFQGDRGLYYDVVLHEIGHILGIGNNWRLSVSPLVNANCEYTGAEATAVYRALSGCANGFPLAECGNGHWSEDCFDAELMTPSRNAGGVLFSEMTVASLDDMGYTTDRNAVPYDFISFDIAQTCRCNTAIKVESGLVWQWDKPIKHKDPPITPELKEEARKAAPPVKPISTLSNGDGDDNITIGTTSTVLFWNEEGGNFYEVSIY